MSDEKKTELFEEDHPASKVMLEWWEGLKQNKGDRAELRRCKSLYEIEMASTFQRFYWKSIDYFESERGRPSREQMAIIVGLAAHVDENNDETKSFGYQISEGQESPKMKELRFRRLLKIKNREKLYLFLIQTIRLLDRKVNLLDLQKISYYWGNKQKKELAYRYYENAKLVK